jgi:hypothetical protein
MTTVRHKLEFTPHQHQWDAYQAALDYYAVWLCGGFGGGKTYTLAQWCWDMATEHCPGVDGLIVEPDFDTFYDIFMPTWKKCFPGEGVLWDLKTTNKGNSKQLVIRLPNGGKSTIYIRSAMNKQTVERIDGLMTIGWAGLDEIARAKAGARAWELVVSRCRNPTPIGNHILVVGKPNGFNWTADAFGLTEDHPPHAWTHGYVSPANDRYFVRVCRTGDNSDYLDPEYEKNLRSFGEDFAAENVEGSLVHSQGAIFPRWSQAMHVIPHEEAQRIWTYKVKQKACGGDWGFTNPAAWLVCGKTGDGDMICVDEWYKKGASPAEQAYHGTRFRRRWGVRTFPYDSAEPGIIAEMNSGYTWKSEPCRLNAIKANKDWEKGVGRIRELMEYRPEKPHPFATNQQGFPVLGSTKFFVSDRCVDFAKELSRYREKDASGELPASEKTEGHDHLIDCARYAALELFGGTEYRGVKAPI